MACSITITDITGGRVAGILTAIVVRGTSTDCTSISVTITTGGLYPVSLDITPDSATGEWVAVFRIFSTTSYGCGRTIQAEARNTDTSSCVATPMSLQFLNCVSDEVPVCPIIDCRQDEEDCIYGSRIVTFTWHVESVTTSPIHYKITEVPDSGILVEGDISSGNIPFRYPTPIIAGTTKNFNFEITTPSYSHCPNPYPFHFTIGDCPPPSCPMEIIWADPVIGECNEDGTREVIINVSFTAPTDIDAELLWNTEVLDEKHGRGPLTLSNSSSTRRRFPAGTTQRFRVIFKNGCTGDSIPVMIPECSCPTIDLVETLGDCTDSNRSLQVTYNINSSSPYEAQLFRDDEPIPVDALIRGSGRRQLTKTDNYGIGSTHRFKAKITFPFACSDERPVDEILIPGCSPPDDEKLSCGLTRLFVVIAFALALIAVAIGFCIPATAPAIFWIAAGLALAAAIMLAIWLALCPKKPCGWGYLLLWQIFLSAGIGVMYFAGCCPWIIYFGIGLLVASVPFIILWIKQCNKTFCAFAKEAASVIVGVVLPLITYILVVRAARGCVIPWFDAILTTVVAVLTIYALRCHDDV